MILTYIAGPMRGHKLFNFPMFDAARNLINSWADHEAMSPADIDREYGFDPKTLSHDYDWNQIPEQAGSKMDIINRDLEELLNCQAIYLLPGWENSKGATAELAIARWAGHHIYCHPGAKNPDLPENQPKYAEAPAEIPAVKDSNPKDNVGSRKPGISAVPCKPLYEAGLALSYGGMKYGKHNWRRIGVRASVYYDAAMRHLMAWWEGETLDPIEKGGSGLPHLAHAIAGLMVYRDAELAGMVTDDRPIATGSPYEHLEDTAAKICDRYPNPVAAYTEARKQQEAI